ncbi:MAG: DNA polymerase III subunit delta [Candidatus Obscuribacterales bacterium]|nr:DNA polymerase III subunit delta [Steroidobacteraceae bacterium]
MKTTTDNLAATLNRGLPSICLISGDDPLLVNEAADLFRAKARDQGYTERELHFVERGFDWQALQVGSRTMSLFADRKLIEVRLNGASPGDGSAVLIEFAERPMPDTLVLVICEKLDGKALNTKWVSAIEKNGVVVQAWPIELARLPAWIRERLGRHGLQADQNTCALIAERVEGNLLAAHQEIEKLALLYPPGELTTESVDDAVADSARFDVLQLGVAAMQGQTARALRILEGLRAEGVDATLVLWGINKDIQWLARCAHLMRSGQSADAAMNAEYVWRPRQAAMKQALTRVKALAIEQLIVDAANVDKAIKGVRRVDAWLELQALVARLAGVKLSRAA